MGGIGRAVAERLAQAGLAALLVATLCFAALHALPGDLALQLSTARYGEGRAGAAEVDTLRREAGLDRPLPAQYAAWLGRLARGDLGRSLLTGQAVTAELGPRLRLTLRVGGLAILLGVALAVPAGIAAGIAPGGRIDRTVASAAALLAASPAFVVASLLVAVLAIRLRWLPVAGGDDALSLLLPTVSLAATLLPGLARVVRHAVAGAAGAFYAAFGRMRGIPPWRIALHLAARPALVPLAAYLPLLAIRVIEGFVTVELVFNLDGVGRLLVRSLLARDLPVVMGAGVAIAGLLQVANLVADLLLHALDPRLRRAPA